MRKASGFVLKNWLWITLGIILTKSAVGYAYQERGYMAYGGEWLVLPIVLLAVKLARDVIGSVMVMFGESYEDEAAAREKAEKK